MSIFYETGIMEPEILGSGSNYSNIFRTKNEEEAIEQYHNEGRNYLVKEIWENGKRNRLIYNYKTGVFEPSV